MSSAVTINIKGLDQLMKALKGKPPVARVGILGESGSLRNKDSGGSSNGPTNAEVGAAHEFGTTKMAKRSFLREPLNEHLHRELENSNAFDADVLKKVIDSGTVVSWLKLVAVTAKTVVLGAFASGGYGKWVPWKNGYSSNTGQILVDTTQLRDSITEEVKE